MRWGSLILVLVAGCAALDGLTGNDDDVPVPARPAICDAPGAPVCVHGTCTQEGDAAKCACETGWAGPTCTECAVGAACQAPSCASTKCAAHATCDDSKGAPACSCVSGYELKDNGCVWKGIVRDPTLEDKPAGAWTTAGGVKIDPALPGVKDPGAAELNIATCSTTAGISQTIDMPAYDLAEPLAIEMFGTARCEINVPIGGPIPIACIRPMALGIGARGIDPFLFLFGPGTVRACLGERAYGGAIPLRLFPQTCGGFTKTNVIDHIDIVPAPECPTPGNVTNGDFEGIGGWTVGGTGAEVAPAIGNKTSRGGLLKHAKRCDNPSLTSAFSVRTASPAKPALAFTVKGKTGRKMSVTAGTQTLATITGTSVYENVVICLPEYTKGMASSLGFAANQDAAGPGACGDADDYEFIVDDVAIVSEPSCEDTTFIVDGGFERLDAARYWYVTEDGGTVQFRRFAGAKTGNGWAGITQSTCQKTSSFSIAVTNPGSVPLKGGPAVEFFYKATTANAVTYSGATKTLTPTNTWTKSIACLSPRRNGFPQSISFSVNAADSCGFGELSLDDLRVTQDVSCPEQ